MCPFFVPSVPRHSFRAPTCVPARKQVLHSPSSNVVGCSTRIVLIFRHANEQDKEDLLALLFQHRRLRRPPIPHLLNVVSSWFSRPSCLERKSHRPESNLFSNERRYVGLWQNVGYRISDVDTSYLHVRCSIGPWLQPNCNT